MNSFVILEVEYLSKLSDSEQVVPENKVSSLGFNIVASSGFGMTVSASKSVIEKTFRSKIKVRHKKVNSGSFVTGKVWILEFTQKPTIPKELLSYIKSVKFPQPIIPLQ